MSNYNSLKATIDANIKQNGNQEITGQILNSVLNQMVTTLGTGYQFAGIATSKTDPGTPDAKVFYIANGKGTYEKFGGINVTEDDVVVLYWDSSWHKVSTGIASDQKLSELGHKVNEMALGKFYGFFPSPSSLPSATDNGYAYVGNGNSYVIYNAINGSWSNSGTSVTKEDVFVTPQMYGAVGDGVTDDTAAFNAAIQAGEMLFVPNGTYMINALTGISLKSNFSLYLLPGAILKAIPNSSNRYAIISITNCENINIYGGKIQGERYDHIGTTGEHGIGINISDSENILIENVEIFDTWGDAVYVGTSSGSTGGHSQNVKIHNCRLHNCRRQGVSVVHCENFILSDSEIYDINGTAPQSGIDFEVNYPSYPNKEITVRNCYFHNNIGIDIVVGNTIDGMSISLCKFKSFNSTRYAKNLKIESCTGSISLGGVDGDEEISILNCTIPEYAAYNYGKTIVKNCIIDHIVYYKNTGYTENMSSIFDSCTIRNPYKENDVSAITDSILNHRIIATAVAKPQSVIFKNCHIIVRSVAGSALGAYESIIIDGCTFSVDFSGNLNWGSGNGFFDIAVEDDDGIIVVKDSSFLLRGLTAYGAYGLFRPSGKNLIVNNVYFDTNSAIGTYAIRSNSENTEIINCVMRKYGSIGTFVGNVFKKGNVISSTESEIVE